MTLLTLKRKQNMGGGREESSFYVKAHPSGSCSLTTGDVSLIIVLSGRAPAFQKSAAKALSSSKGLQKACLGTYVSFPLAYKNLSLG